MSTRTGALNPTTCRGVVRASVMRIETKIPIWEEKETLHDWERPAVNCDDFETATEAE